MSTAVQKRVLFISYAFPPTGGAGVQRATKFVKFLPSFGWQPTVLTVENPSVPVQDQHLLADISSTVTILRARTLEPGYGVKQQLVGQARSGTRFRRLIRSIAMSLLQPDPQILWNTAAYRTACRQLTSVQHDAILVTGPPFSSFLLGAKLKKKFGLPLVLDFRDEWALVNRHLENHRPGPLSRLRQKRMRRLAMRSADALIATTARSAGELASECLDAGQAENATCIYNGFDWDDLKELSSHQETSAPYSALQFVYTGTLWNLTDIGPFASALHRLAESERKRNIEFRIAGRCTDSQSQLVREVTNSACAIELAGYLPHKDALQLAATADVLVLTLADKPGAERVVPAKIFEYMALGKIILAIVPAGETREILDDYPRSHVFHPSDVAGIARWVEGLRENDAILSTSLPPTVEAVNQYSRSAQAEQLACVLNGLCHSN